MSVGWDAITPKLCPEIRETLAELKFSNATPIQAAAIPLFLQKKDVAAEAVTGSGKTLAFIIPILEILKDVSLNKHDIGAVVISPTRELASQIAEVLTTFCTNLPQISHQKFIGGSDINADLDKFNCEGGNVIVATPGRLEDLMFGKSKADSRTKFMSGLRKLEVLVLDEADRLLSMGFHQTVNTIISGLPKQRRTGLFSATQAKDIDQLIRAGLRNPVLISVKEKEEVTPSSLQNFYTVCDPPSKKFAMLVHFLRQQFSSDDVSGGSSDVTKKSKIILFFATGACVEYFTVLLSRLLKKHSANIFSIHRQKAKRDKVFESFRKADSGLLVCTDVMARGVDIPHVNWVLQYDPPSNAEAFVHRCGRTARIGNEGNALVFLLPTEDAYVEFIHINQKVSLKPMSIENDASKLPNLTNEVRSWQRNDRSIFDKANRAFVSYIQAYSKHECKWVLRLKDLPFGEIAMSMSLLKMPKMPELKGRKVVGFVGVASKAKNDEGQKGSSGSKGGLDLNEIKYTDKKKEQSRQEKLTAFRDSGNWPGSKKAKKAAETVAWSQKVDKKAKREDRKRKHELKRKTEMEEMAAADSDDDDDDLEEDFRLLKKLKKGKASQAEFDKKIQLEKFDEEEEEVTS